MTGSEAGTRVLSVREWRQMALGGVEIPMRFTVGSDSMRPLIRMKRDVVTLMPLDRPPRPGDVVLFSPNGGEPPYVLHRVLKVEGKTAQTMGDNCYKPDGWIPFDDIWGLALKVRKKHISIRPGGLVWGRLARAWFKVRLFMGRVRGLAGRILRAGNRARRA